LTIPARQIAALGQGQGEGGRLAAGQSDGHGVGKAAAHQRRIGRAGGGRRAGAGRPAASQVWGVLVQNLDHASCYRAGAVAQKDFFA
jgi:hypothetical protein